MGYVPRARKKTEKIKKHKIGIITQLAKSSFMIEINRGILQAKRELENWGVELLIRESISVNEEEQLAAHLGVLPPVVDLPIEPSAVAKPRTRSPFSQNGMGSIRCGDGRAQIAGFHRRSRGREIRGGGENGGAWVRAREWRQQWRDAEARGSLGGEAAGATISGAEPR